MGRRHSSTGGDADQSVLICTPRAAPSRSGPRKPGQSAPVSAAGEVDEGAAAADEGGSGWSHPCWARRRSSGVLDQRQWKSFLKSPEAPAVRRSVNTPHPSRIAAAITARRGAAERRRLTAAAATRARLIAGIAMTKSKNPILPVAIDTWTIRFVPITARTIRTRAPRRSYQGARLSNNHQRTIAKAHEAATIIA